MTTQLGFSPAQTWAIGLLAAVALVLLYLVVMGLRNRTIAKLGVRNIPRRRSQSALIILGLTLSTIIIVSALSIGDTLSYSVRRHAINAYGTIDQVISPPLLSALAGLVTSAEDGGNPADALAGSELSGVLNGDLLSILGLLQKGLPGISEARYAQLRDQAQADPATAAVVDGLAPSIAFPTIIRDRTSGQGIPLGFIVAVNNEYDEQFGLTTVDGKPVQMEDLRTGVGNIFAQASNLFRWADSIGINVDSVAAGIAQAGALITQGQGLLNEATGEATGTPTRPLTETLTPLPPDFGGTPTRPLTETLAPPAPGTGQPDIAALGRALSGGNLDLAAAGAALGLNTDAILSAVNLNTLGMEIDRVLEQVGLELRQGDVYLNRLGAEQLNAQPGDVLDIFIGPIPVPFRVRAVVEQAGPLGALKPVVMLRLDEAQELLFMPGRVNNVLVSNTGDAYTGMENTAAAARQLRALALNEDALTELLALLREPDMLAAIAAGADGSAPSTLSREEADMADFMAFIGGGGGGMGNVALAERTPRLVAELTGAGVSPELRVLVAQPDMQNWLRRLPLPGETSVKLDEILGRISDLEVLDVLSKNTVVAAAGIGGTVFTTVFTIFGIFSIFAGVLLIFLIFVMLAAERRSEMGMARAIGMQRGHLVQMFVSEGMIYDLVAAALGIVLGLAISYAMIGFLGGIFNTAAQQVSSEISSSLFTFHFNVAPTSVVIAYALGVLLTFAVVTVSSWRVSRLNIVSAILDTPEPDGGQRSAGKLIGRLITGPLTVAAGAWLTFGVAGGGSGVLLLIALSMLLVGGLLSVSWSLSTTSMRTERRRRLVYT
ncbi:MAG: FtsX-like permease family protein, partial [Anaerolineae bacterium]